MTRAAIYFASGSNRPAEIRGLDRIGHAIGVAAPELTAAAIAELVKVSVPVFVDSGAFSEIEFTESGPVVVKPLGHEDWTRILAIYLRLARALGDRLYVVAPDMVGFQAETLERMRRYAPAIRQIRELGANVLAPIQKGAMSQAEFDLEVEAALGFGDYVRAMPCKKSATTSAELAAFVSARRPERIHLLGLGVRNKAAARYVKAASRFGAVVTLDSNMLKASVGRSNGRKNMASEVFKGRRVYTRAQDTARELIAAGLTSETCPRELGILLAFTPIRDEAARWALIARKAAARAA